MKIKDNKKKYEFSIEEKNDIISKYKNGLSCNKIAEDYPCSSKTIERFLKIIGISTKDNPNNKTLDDLPIEDKIYITSNYINGVSASVLGNKYNCNEGTIRKFLKKNNINFKDAKHYNLREFSDEEINVIINKYINGISITDLTKEYNCNYKTLNKLVPTNIKSKYKSNKSNKNKYRKYIDILDFEKSEIINKYLDGIYQKELSMQYNCSVETIKKVLNEFNLCGNNNPKWDKANKNFSEKSKLEIIELYKKGYIQEDLATQYECSRDYIREILYEYGYSYKDNPNYNYKISEIINSQDVIELYNNNYSISNISQKYNVNPTVISNILSNNNIKIRQCTEIFNYSEEDLLNYLNEIYDVYGYVNTELLNSLDNYPTSVTYVNRFGCFKNAMKKANLPYSSLILWLDNEMCKSAYEYRFSITLKKYNIQYERDYLYSNLISNFNRKHTIDYKITYGNKILYLEIFGMSGSSFNDNKYNKTKEFKIKLCNENNIKLIGLYPSDFKFDNDNFEKHIIKILQQGYNK